MNREATLLPHLFWDASALAKRFIPETGSRTVAALFEMHHVAMVTTLWGYAETYSILVRNYNSGRLSLTSFHASAAALKNDIVDNPDFRLLKVEDSAVLEGLIWMRLHNLNATDAALLSLLLAFRQTFPKNVPCFLVTADKRLARAAMAEGLRVLNPEEMTEREIASLFRERHGE